MAPLSADPTGQEIWNEFGGASKPSTPAGTAYSLDDADTKIFGAGIHNRLDFANLGQPAASSIAVGSTDTDEFTINFDLDINGVDTDVKLEWHEDDGNVPFSGQTISDIPFTTYSVNGNYNLTATGLSSDTTYYYRLVYFNAFNDDASDYIESSAASVMTDAPAQLATPDIASGTVEYNTTSGYLSFSYADSEDNFEVQTRVDGSASTTTIQCTKNVGTSNTAIEIRADFNTLPSTSVEFRVRATSSSLTDSAWSAWETASSVPSVPSCPL